MYFNLSQPGPKEKYGLNGDGTMISRAIRIMIVCFFVLAQSRAYALPIGEVVASGSATFDRSISDQLHINQSTDRLITNYTSFSIASPELVQFHQPDSSSVALNRVVGGTPSSIFGSLQANGQVFLINPNGIIF